MLSHDAFVMAQDPSALRKSLPARAAADVTALPHVYAYRLCLGVHAPHGMLRLGDTVVVSRFDASAVQPDGGANCVTLASGIVFSFLAGKGLIAMNSAADLLQLTQLKSQQQQQQQRRRRRRHDATDATPSGPLDDEDGGSHHDDDDDTIEDEDDGPRGSLEAPVTELPGSAFGHCGEIVGTRSLDSRRKELRREWGVQQATCVSVAARSFTSFGRALPWIALLMGDGTLALYDGSQASDPATFLPAMFGSSTAAAFRVNVKTLLDEKVKSAEQEERCRDSGPTRFSLLGKRSLLTCASTPLRVSDAQWARARIQLMPPDRVTGPTEVPTVVVSVGGNVLRVKEAGIVGVTVIE